MCLVPFARWMCGIPTLRCAWPVTPVNGGCFFVFLLKGSPFTLVEREDRKARKLWGVAKRASPQRCGTIWYPFTWVGKGHGLNHIGGEFKVKHDGSQ